MSWLDQLGLVAAFFTTSAAIPQLVKIIQTKHAGDVSIIMFLMTLTGVVLWLIYGFLMASTPLIAANSASLIIVGLIIYFKLKYNQKTC